MIQFQLQFLFLPLFLLFSFTETLASICNQTCGGISVPYPFGFSAGCAIRLTCTDATIRIGEFSLRNITSDTLLLDLPPSCNRSISSSSTFFSRNYALTTNNGLFLRNCSANSKRSPLIRCSISTEFISTRLDTKSCGRKDDSTSCFGSNTSSGNFLTYGELTAASCSSLFTAVRYANEDGNVTANVFSEVELGWWIEGSSCSCTDNATCTRVVLPGSGKAGFRCECKEGLAGDGFVDGQGCFEG